jgi:UDP-N-acetylmuramate dehydrogenase
MEKLKRRLHDADIEYFVDVEGRTVSSYRGGGNLALVICPKSVDEIKTALAEIKYAGVPYTLLGAGSNCLVPDSGYPGAVIRTTRLKGISQSGSFVTAYAGETLSSLAAFAAKHDLGGMEALSGIPATVGGAVRMNAGAYGKEIAGLLTQAEILDARNLEVSKKDRTDIPFSYRSSGDAFQYNIIYAATFRFQDGYDRALHRHCCEDRLKKQPGEPSLGSVFKNPLAFAAGYLIETVGLKGFRIGNAAISAKHANFIVNLGGGTARDYLSLMGLAQSMVYNEYKIELEPEIHILG